MDEVKMRGRFYCRKNLQATILWARSRIATASRWERVYLSRQIERMELALRAGEAA